MNVGHHIIASGIISGFVWFYFKSAHYAFISFLAGTCVDLDHFIDYYASYGFTLDLKRVYDACVLVKLRRLYLVLHSYEIIALLWGAIYFFGLGDFWKAAAIGLTQHIIFDQLTNPLVGGGYFLAYRMVNGFDSKRLLKAA